MTYFLDFSNPKTFQSVDEQLFSMVLNSDSFPTTD